jgi:hypothetical protein
MVKSAYAAADRDTVVRSTQRRATRSTAGTYLGSEYEFTETLHPLKHSISTITASKAIVGYLPRSNASKKQCRRNDQAHQRTLNDLYPGDVASDAPNQFSAATGGP